MELQQHLFETPTDLKRLITEQYYSKYANNYDIFIKDFKRKIMHAEIFYNYLNYNIRPQRIMIEDMQKKLEFWGKHKFKSKYDFNEWFELHKQNFWDDDEYFLKNLNNLDAINVQFKKDHLFYCEEEKTIYNQYKKIGVKYPFYAEYFCI